VRAAGAGDVVVHGAVGQDRGIPQSTGEAEWDKVRDVRHLERLRRIRGLLSARGIDTAHARPACYSGRGFTPALQAAASRGEVILVDLQRLYGGARRRTPARPPPAPRTCAGIGWVYSGRPWTLDAVERAQSTRGRTRPDS
jgi:hypothetical protein